MGAPTGGPSSPLVEDHGPGAGPPPDRDPRSQRERRLAVPELGGLLVLIAGYAVVVTYLSYLRYTDFYTACWDLGINQQLLWTTAHGRVLYETADLSFFNAHSYLQVHSTYLAFLVAPVYSSSASPVTLFALQAAVFGVSAVPLYAFARETLRRPALRVAMVGLYLGSFGVLAALLFDFHWEAFLPLCLLTFFLLVRRERYLLSVIPLAIGTLTLEVFPFLAGGVLLFYLYERADALHWDWRQAIRDHRIRILCGLAVLSAAAYGAVRLLQYVVVPTLLGVPSTSGGSASGVSTVLAWSVNSVTFPPSLGYWLLLLAALAFLPVLAPRYLILSLPWFVYSVIVSPWFSNYFGTAYAFIPTSTLAIAAIAGLGRIERAREITRLPLYLWASLVGGTGVLTALALVPGESADFLRYSGPGFWLTVLALFVVAGLLSYQLRRDERSRTARSPGPEVASPRSSARPYRTVLAALAVLFVVVLVFDVVMSPMNPGNFEATPVGGYKFSWQENPMFPEIGWVTGMLPADAQVLASNHLFPYVANDPNAWALPDFALNVTPTPAPYLPFTSQNLPRFVLTDVSERQWIPSFLATDLANSSVYGLVAYAAMSSYPGTVSLFELGYSGPTQEKVVTASPGP